MFFSSSKSSEIDYFTSLVECCCLSLGCSQCEIHWALILSTLKPVAPGLHPNNGISQKSGFAREPDGDRPPALVESMIRSLSRSWSEMLWVESADLHRSKQHPGQCGFNQRLMKNGRGLEVLSGSGSCSAEHLCSLPSTQSCSPAPSASATHLESCWGDGSSSWLSCRTPMWHWDFGFPVCSSSGVGCPAPQLCPWGAGQPVLDWPFAGSAEILSFHPNQEKAQILKFQNPFKHKA